MEFRFLEEREIQGFPNYKIYENGDIYSFTTRQEMNPCINGKGYKVVSLCHQGKKTRFYHHRLVAEVFIPNPLNLPVVNHKDKNRTNNDVTNLEWVTYKENSEHSVKMGVNHKTQKVFQYSLSGKFIEEFSSIKKASEKTNVASGLIGACLNNKQKTAGGFVWRKEKSFKFQAPEEIDLTESIILENFSNYCIFRDGRIYSKHRKRLLEPVNGEYLTLGMTNDDGIVFSFRAHVLVALAFLPNSGNCPIVNHLDGNKHNNSVENLEWTTYAENSQHAWDNGLIKKSQKKGYKRHNQKKGRKIAKYDREDNFIEEYDSLKEAAEINNICKSAISDVARGSKAKTAGGFIWKYV